jgi:hypothetical protein
MRSSILLATAAMVPLCTAFSPALPLSTRAVSLSTPSICSVRASAAYDGIESRRGFLAAGFALASGALIPSMPAFAAEVVAPAAAPPAAAPAAAAPASELTGKVTTGNYIDGKGKKFVHDLACRVVCNPFSLLRRGQPPRLHEGCY